MGVLALLKHKPSAVASASEAEQANIFISNELVAEASKNAVKNLPCIKDSSGNFVSLLGETEAPAIVGKVKEGEEKENTFEKCVLINIYGTPKNEAASSATVTVTVETVALPVFAISTVAVVQKVLVASFYL